MIGNDIDLAMETIRKIINANKTLLSAAEQVKRTNSDIDRILAIDTNSAMLKEGVERMVYTMQEVIDAKNKVMKLAQYILDNVEKIVG